MLTKKEVRTIHLTPEAAKLFATMPALPGERDLKPARIEFLANHVRKGTFFGPEWAEVHEKATGKVYRCNGQHSSTMLANLNPDIFPQGLKATIAVYQIDSVDEDGYTLFELFDNPASVRTTEDVMGVGTAQYPELNSITRKFLVKAAHGITASIKSANAEAKAAYDKAKKKDADAVEPSLEDVPSARRLSAYYGDPVKRQFVQWLAGLAANDGQPVSLSFVFGAAGVVAVMFSDWRRDTPFATTFWKYVLNESHPDPQHFSRELAVQLREWKNESPRRTQKEFQKLAAKQSKRAAQVEVTSKLNATMLGRSSVASSAVQAAA